ncbi:sigma-70 family RNA polymerase sigma factor [Kitasatospora sp. NPDC048296]|jgi:RNA polymerase sigma-70 factor (ECF subfamily)|uniref:sigma-70 family RNA polymerase sigma factor n=1 Tax=Kitasatospora sp. NPDC048296 TaxID=3364048 RepID=UPI00371221EF
MATAALDQQARVRNDEEVVTEEHPAGGSAAHGTGAADEELMRALYREHAGPLYGFVLHLVAGDRQHAEEVVQETLVRAWRNIHRLDPQAGSLRPWLVTVARRIVIDDHRSARARPREVDAAALEQLPAEDEIDRALRMMTVADALGDLSPAHREIIVETYLKGRTAREAAAELGIPAGTVRSRVFYALRSLRLALEERGVTS